MPAQPDGRTHVRDAPEEDVPMPPGHPGGVRGHLLGGVRNTTKARVYRVRSPERDRVVKTSAGCGFLARWLLRRESRAFQRMPPLACLPRVLEASPAHLVTEWIESRDLFEFRKAGLSRAQCDALTAAVAELHAAGFAHGDLGRHDILFTPDGRVVLIDFATAVGPGCPPVVGRLLAPLLQRIDRGRVARIVARYGKTQ